MLYPKSTEPTLARETFQSPGAVYRGTPFWSWNTLVTDALVTEQIDVFRRMGFGGFHVHPRTGLQTAYMSEEYLRLVKLADETAKQQGMLCWLYDEDRYPSGAAGGLVTADPAMRSRNLVLTRTLRTPYAPGVEGFCPDRASFEAACAAGDIPRGYYVTSYRVRLDADGTLADYSRTERDAQDSGDALVWHAYLELMREDPWFNDQTYLDCMNKTGVERFIEATHARYAQVLGDEFGKSIPAIFTDEPHVKGRQTHPFARSECDIAVTYTDDFSDTYRAAHGYEILDYLPELLWELPAGAASVHRWRYHDHIAERFVSAFCDTLGAWCKTHNIALTGHFLSERTLFSQTLALGEAMRCYRSFQLPGIDILADQKEFSTAKQAVSVARQNGCEGVLSELYGVTEWDADFKTYKLQGDWQAALGVTIRVPHLSFMSMEGEAKRDWPASISYQSPWFAEYTMVEDHFARLNTALTRGKAHVRVGVIHPIESFWLAFGPSDQTQAARDDLDENFEHLMQWLLYGLIDFDLISESLLPEQCPTAAAPLQVGLASYDAIIVPACRTLRATTLDRLEAFAAAGGTLIFAGEVPTLENAEPSPRPAALAQKAMQIPFAKEAMLAALKPVREVSVRMANGKRSANLMHQMRADGDGRWLFLCHVNRTRTGAPEPYHLTLRGAWSLTMYDTATGEIHAVSAANDGAETRAELSLYAQDSVLLHLQPAPANPQTTRPVPCIRVQPAPPDVPKLCLTAPHGYRLTEPNALLLDFARASLDGAPFGARTEILRLDNEIRAALGYPGREDHFIQPWAQAEEALTHRVTLSYTFSSAIACDGCLLAMERPEQAAITLNGKSAGADCGWYVDQFIRTVPLPQIRQGENTLAISVPFGKKTNLEPLYILGDFGVAMGVSPMMTARPAALGLGDITRQGLPFYTGNVLYEFEFTLDSADSITVEVPHICGPVVGVSVDGTPCGRIAYAPHRLTLPRLTQGVHKLELCLFGNRFNGFGTLHNCNPDYTWYGPNAYRTTGDEWTEGYALRPMGILSRVELYGSGLHRED